jgi:Spy/CpxP family protein refolding chaperone
MNKQRILIIALVVLVLLNITTLSFLWMTKYDKHPHRSKKNKPHVEQYLTRKLDLSTEQAKSFKLAREQHFEQTHELQRSLHDNRKKLTELLSDADTSKQNELFQKIANQNIQIEKLNFQHLQNLRSVCTDEQKLKFDSVIFKVIDKGAGMRRKVKSRKKKK